MAWAFAGPFGALLGLALLKFGNPVILEGQVEWPDELLKWIIDPWPMVVGYWLLAAVVVMGLAVARWRVDAPRWLVVLPLAWLVWEVVAGTQTVKAVLTRATLAHFASCVVCFYLGLFALSRVRRLGLFWTGLLAGFALVLVYGFQQHFGGLEETRRYFHLYHPDTAGYPKEYLDRMDSNRIFASLIYANALAGVILMLLPMTLGVIGSLRTQLTLGARLFLMAVAGVAGLACLYWSGSKGGWLLMLLTGLVAALFLPVKRQFKVILVGTALALGLAGFFVKYSGFFRKGAPSVVARFDYWTAAGQIIADKPVFGSGPGTFAVAYAKVKKPEWEMARLTHNDYLEQASDSGVPGMVLYTALVAGTLICTGRRAHQDWLRRAVWLGVLGWGLQSFVEFGLYIPAIAWPAFTFMGWLLGQGANPSTAAGAAATIGPSR
jgi:putative inorganic carbon (HCO3(-)) transporter